jgi:hypothetical protein
MIPRHPTPPNWSSRRRAPLIVVAALLMLGIAACGGGNTGPDAQNTGTGSQSPPTTSPPSSKSTPKTPTPQTSRGTQSGTPLPIRTTGQPSPRGAAAGGSTGTLDLSCARRGVDTQGLTVKTKPGGSAGFNSIYSDGSSNLDTSYNAGYGGGYADSQGKWRQTWVVPANAPSGLATVRIAVQDGFFDVSYTVVDRAGSCP